MKWTSDARIWGLIGFGVGAVLASGGSLNTPLDSILGGAIQAAIWFFASKLIIRFITKRKMKGDQMTSTGSPKRLTILLFDRPVSKDWLFYVFLVFLVSNIVNGLSNVSESGGFTTDSFGLVSGVIDGAFRIIFSWFPIIPVVYFVRKAIRKRRSIE